MKAYISELHSEGMGIMCRFGTEPESAVLWDSFEEAQSYCVVFNRHPLRDKNGAWRNFRAASFGRKFIVSCEAPESRDIGALERIYSLPDPRHT